MTKIAQRFVIATACGEEHHFIRVLRQVGTILEEAIKMAVTSGIGEQAQA